MTGLNNKKIGFIIDSSSNIKDGEFDDVKVIPLGVSVQHESDIKTFKDGINFGPDDLKLNMSAKDTVIKTSQASMPDMFAAAEDMCSKYDQVFVLPIHQKLSGNYNSWRMVKEDFTNLNIVMSYDIGASFAWTIEEIKTFLKENEATEKSVQDFIDQKVACNRIGFLMVNDLEQLVKGGRVSGFKAAIAKLFKIKPIILFCKDGLISLDKAKDNEGFFKVVDEYIEKNFNGKKMKRVILFVPHNEEEITNQFKLDYQAHYGSLPFESKQFPTVVVSHTGLKHSAIYAELE